MDDAAARTPKPKTATLILDQGQQGKELARLNVAIWPTVGARIDLPETRRMGLVRNVRLRLTSSTALIVIEVATGPE
jgi:hypothetical protein